MTYYRGGHIPAHVDDGDSVPFWLTSECRGATVTTDYGTASLIRHTVTGAVTVEHADPVIGVDGGLLSSLRVTGHLADDVLTLDTAGEYRYRRLGPSSATPDVTRFERIAEHGEPSVARPAQADLIEKGKTS
jgi:hypothetical protein